MCWADSLAHANTSSPLSFLACVCLCFVVVQAGGVQHVLRCVQGPREELTGWLRRGTWNQHGICSRFTSDLGHGRCGKDPLILWALRLIHTYETESKKCDTNDPSLCLGPLWMFLHSLEHNFYLDWGWSLFLNFPPPRPVQTCSLGEAGGWPSNEDLFVKLSIGTVIEMSQTDGSITAFQWSHQATSKTLGVKEPLSLGEADAECKYLCLCRSRSDCARTRTSSRTTQPVIWLVEETIKRRWKNSRKQNVRIQDLVHIVSGQHLVWISLRTEIDSGRQVSYFFLLFGICPTFSYF